MVALDLHMIAVQSVWRETSRAFSGDRLQSMPEGHAVKFTFSLAAMFMLDPTVIASASLKSLNKRAEESQRYYWVFRLANSAALHDDL